MAIKRVQGPFRGTATTPDSTIQVLLSSVPRTGDILVATISVGVNYNDTLVTVSSISHIGVTWTRQVNETHTMVGSGANTDSEIWIGSIVGSRPTTIITVNLSSALSDVYSLAVVNICEYSGLSYTITLDSTTTGGSGQSTTILTTSLVSINQASDLAIGSISNYNNGGPNLAAQSAPTNGYTLLDGANYNNANSISNAYLEKIVSGPGLTSSGTTAQTDVHESYAACIATFRAFFLNTETVAGVDESFSLAHNSHRMFVDQIVMVDSVVKKVIRSVRDFLAVLTRPIPKIRSVSEVVRLSPFIQAVNTVLLLVDQIVMVDSVVKKVIRSVRDFFAVLTRPIPKIRSLSELVRLSPFIQAVNTVLLLHMEGANGSTSFPDSSIQNQSVTSVNGASIDTGQSPPFGTGAGKFVAANTQYLTVPNSSDWQFGLGNFTVDFWVKFNSVPTSGNYMYVASQRVDANNYWTILLQNTGTGYVFGFVSKVAGVSQTFTITAPDVTTAFAHIAFVVSGSTFYLFYNGTLKNSWATTAVIGFNSALNIGQWNLQGYFDGWLKELRVSNGIARWTSNFTPPTAPYLPEVGFVKLFVFKVFLDFLHLIDLKHRIGHTLYLVFKEILNLVDYISKRAVKYHKIFTDSLNLADYVSSMGRVIVGAAIAFKTVGFFLENRLHPTEKQGDTPSAVEE